MKILVADSGGTKTDWCLIHENGKKDFFTTESYHPNNWDSIFFMRIENFWKEFNLEEIKVYFFGAGCLNPKNSNFLELNLRKLAFKDVSIMSDLHGAGYAALGDKNGTVAIIGTGSVLFEWNNQQVKNIVGGRGHIKGDEGSGYYFGKLVLESYQKKQLTKVQQQIIKQKVAEIDSLELIDKFKLAQFAFLLSNHQSQFKLLHEENARLFANSHLLKKVNELFIIGSYGKNHQLFFEQALLKKGGINIHFIERPINALVEQKMFFIE